MPNTKRILSALLVSVALAGGLAACGGSSEQPPPPAAESPEPAALTRADLISEGDGLCAEVNAAIGSITDSTIIAETDKESQISELYAGLADRLEKLGTPDDGDAPTEVIAALRELGGEADSGTTTEESGAVEGDDDGTDGTDSANTEAGGDPSAFREAAEAYGFTDCAEGPSAPVTAGPGEEGTGEAPAAPEPAPSEGYEEPAPAPAPAPEPAPAPVPAPDTGGVNPDAPSTGGSAPPSGGSGGSGTGGIGPG